MGKERDRLGLILLRMRFCEVLRGPFARLAHAVALDLTLAVVVLRLLRDFPGRFAQVVLAGVTGSTGLDWMDIVGAYSCGLFPRWSAGSGNLATPERLDDAHRSAAIGAWLL